MPAVGTAVSKALKTAAQTAASKVFVMAKMTEWMTANALETGSVAHWVPLTVGNLAVLRVSNLGVLKDVKKEDEKERKMEQRTAEATVDC